MYKSLSKQRFWIESDVHVFYTDGPAGSGKTYLYTKLLHFVRKKGGVALAVAWSGLAADVQSALQAQFTAPEAAILWDSTPIKPSEYDVANAAPFNKAINVFGTGVPPH